MHHFLFKIYNKSIIFYFLLNNQEFAQKMIFLKNYDIFISSNLSNIEFHTNLLVIDFGLINQTYSTIIPQYLNFFWVIGVETDFLSYL